jgi:hypothetical protein
MRGVFNNLLELVRGVTFPLLSRMNSLLLEAGPCLIVHKRQNFREMYGNAQSAGRGPPIIASAMGSVTLRAAPVAEEITL